MMTEKMRLNSTAGANPENGCFLHGDELGELARMLQAHTAAGASVGARDGAELFRA